MEDTQSIPADAFVASRQTARSVIPSTVALIDTMSSSELSCCFRWSQRGCDPAGDHSLLLYSS